MEFPTTKKPLGILSLTSLVTGTMIGSGIFLLPAQLAKLGTMSLLSWIITTFGAILLGIILAKMSILVPKNGGPYAYSRAGLGDFIGFQTAYTHWIALWESVIALILAMFGYLAIFFPILTQTLPMFISSIAILWILTIYNTRGAKAVGILQTITTILKILPILAIIVFGFIHFNANYLSFDFDPTNHSYNYSILSSAAGVTLWSFIGMEAATIPYDHVKNPEKTIPLATILGIIIASLIYIASSIVIIGLIPIGELANSATSPFITAAELLFGNTGKWIIIAGAIISCLGCANGLMFIQGQIASAAAENNLFPSVFAQKNKHQMPSGGLIITAMIQTVVLAMLLYKTIGDQFDIIVAIASLAALIPYLYSMAASLVVFKQQQHNITNSIYIFIAFLTAIYSFWILTIMKNTVILHGSFLIFIGVILYAILYDAQEKIK